MKKNKFKRAPMARSMGDQKALLPRLVEDDDEEDVDWEEPVLVPIRLLHAEGEARAATFSESLTSPSFGTTTTTPHDAPPRTEDNLKVNDSEIKSGTISPPAAIPEEEIFFDSHQTTTVDLMTLKSSFKLVGEEKFGPFPASQLVEIISATPPDPDQEEEEEEDESPQLEPSSNETTNRPDDLAPDQPSPEEGDTIEAPSPFGVAKEDVAMTASMSTLRENPSPPPIPHEITNDTCNEGGDEVEEEREGPANEEAATTRVGVLFRTWPSVSSSDYEDDIYYPDSHTAGSSSIQSPHHFDDDADDDGDEDDGPENEEDDEHDLQRDNDPDLESTADRPFSWVAHDGDDLIEEKKTDPSPRALADPSLTDNAQQIKKKKRLNGQLLAKEGEEEERSGSTGSHASSVHDLIAPLLVKFRAHRLLHRIQHQQVTTSPPGSLGATVPTPEEGTDSTTGRATTLRGHVNNAHWLRPLPMRFSSHDNRSGRVHPPPFRTSFPDSAPVHHELKQQGAPVGSNPSSLTIAAIQETPSEDSRRRPTLGYPRQQNDDQDEEKDDSKSPPTVGDDEIVMADISGGARYERIRLLRWMVVLCIALIMATMAALGVIVAWKKNQSSPASSVSSSTDSSNDTDWAGFWSSRFPSEAPTRMPSTWPSSIPTALPSVIPSVHPSGGPSGLPSRLPTPNPSGLPTQLLSAYPSGGPSGSPTLSPVTTSHEPTALAPSSSPTIWPTPRPFGIPSTFPTSSPSSSPTTRSCFTIPFLLTNAVDRYLGDPNPDSTIARKYGWPMSSWCVGSISSFRQLFSVKRNQYSSVFANLIMTTNEDISSWNVSSRAVDLSYTFQGAISFNQPLSSWNVSRVTSLEGTFESAWQFNQNLSSWQVESALTMAYMFQDAVRFNKPLDAWRPLRVRNLTGLFLGARSFSQNLCAWGPYLTSQSSGSPIAVQDMFVNTACPTTQDPNLTATPPGPFCYPCS